MKRAAKNITFLGWQDDEVLKRHYSEAKAFIFPGEEDFGITPVEAQASGTPVIGFGKGGLLETVEENNTGLFFMKQDAESLIEAVNKFGSSKARKNAEKFDILIFEKNMKTFIMEKYADYCERFGL